MSVPKRPVVVTDEARDDMRSVALYGLLNWGDEQAERYHASIAAMLDSLARFPKLGRRAADVTGNVRVAGVGHRRILYRVEADSILVLRVLHERMEAAPQPED